MQTISIRQAIEEINKFKGWLYLGPRPWTLGSQGFFYSANLDLSPVDEKKIRDGFEAQGWKSTLSKEDIEDVIENTKDQIEDPSIDQLFEAFNFFYENDAYIEW
ncbi:DUF7716 domain-containing protein [Variovorax paradoxus]|uniref:DUF7716 domain-containing protein n=1 Tax=Variovorax paradoxus TaxID=34073 RepID=UPI0029C61BFC|nr:hypothetical protein [Variovorax paradoxus]WPH23686.1 hypothetical protein RZE78_32080 [Variovorax paradoxus]